MNLLRRTCDRIAVPSPAIFAETQRRLDDKTKPRRSLGRLEDLACQLAAIQDRTAPTLRKKAVVVLAADHGVTEEGVSAYPQEVTRQMMLNFASGGAAINVLAAQAGAHLRLFDFGVREPLPPHPTISAIRIGASTRNLARQSAMEQREAVAALEAGITIASELSREGFDCIGLGEMGIGNTTSASALLCALHPRDPEEAVGRGTGIDERAYRHKIEVVRRAIALHSPDPADPLNVLACLGGFEIAGLAGVALGAAAERMAVVMDGFISSAAALVASRLAPACRGYLIGSHRSVEPGHRAILRELGARPLLDLELRLGEGSGAALALPLLDAALAILDRMATFADAKVSDSGA